jgi:excisionase family DNA binding protein
MMADTLPKLLTLAAVADALSISSHTVRKMVRDGRLRPTRICRRLLFNPADVERLLESSR